MRNLYNVLLIEDDDTAAELATAQLALADQFGFIVSRARTREQALQLVLDDHSFDAALMDMELPDATGTDTLSDLVAHAPALAVVALTSNSPETAFRLLRRGASDFVTKAEATSDRLARAIAYAVERKQFENGTRRLAETDTLTGTGNRRRLDRGLSALNALRRRHGGAVVVALFDLDNFRSVNETYGHHIGDQALVAIADALEHDLREEDTVARVGADEFAIAMLVDDENGVGPILKRIHERVQGRLSALAHPCSASAGAVAVATDCCLDDMLKYAHESLHHAKAQAVHAVRRHSQVIDLREQLLEVSA